MIMLSKINILTDNRHQKLACIFQLPVCTAQQQTSGIHLDKLIHLQFVNLSTDLEN